MISVLCRCPQSKVKNRHSLIQSWYFSLVLGSSLHFNLKERSIIFTPKRISRNFVSDFINTSKGFDLSFFITETFEIWSLTINMLSFSDVPLYMVHLLYFQTQYISYAEFFTELFCVARQNGHQGEILSRRKKIFVWTCENVYDVCANCKISSLILETHLDGMRMF